MKEKIVNKRSLVIALSFLSVMLLLGMTVSANVNYAQAKQTNADGILDKLNSVMNSPSYKKLKAQAERFMDENSNDSYQQDFYNRTLQKLMGTLPITHTPYAPLLCEILVILVEASLALFGHNAIGLGIATFLVYTVGFCGSIIAGVGLVPILCLASVGFILDLIGAFLGSEDILYDFGIFGIILIILIGLPLILLLLTIGLPLIYIGACLLIMEDCITEVNEQFPYR